MVLLYFKPDIPGFSMYTVVWLIWRSFCQYYLVDYRKCFKMSSVRLVNLVFVMFFCPHPHPTYGDLSKGKGKIIINHIQQQAHSGDTVVYITLNEQNSQRLLLLHLDGISTTQYDIHHDSSTVGTFRCIKALNMTQHNFK